MSFSKRKLLHFLVLGFAIVGMFVVALYLADYVTNNDMARSLVGQFGYIGVFVVAVITGINVLVPVPAATFVPVFTAAGLWLPLIILMLVIGTTVADMVGYVIGRWGKDFAAENYPHTYSRLIILNEEHHTLVLPLLFIYAAFIPFPNEAVIIPLTVMGFKFRDFLIPILLGNLVNQTALAYGATNVFKLIF